MARVFLISAKTLKENSIVNNNVDEMYLLPAIEYAQDAGLQPIIGTKLYNKLMDMVADGSFEPQPEPEPEPEPQPEPEPESGETSGETSGTTSGETQEETVSDEASDEETSEEEPSEGGEGEGGEGGEGGDDEGGDDEGGDDEGGDDEGGDEEESGSTINVEDYKTLLDEYVTPYLINKATADIQLPLAFKLRNQGVVQQTSDNTYIPGIRDIQYLIQDYENKAIFYGNRMSDFLRANRSKYPEYCSVDSCADMRSNKGAYKTGICLG